MRLETTSFIDENLALFTGREERSIISQMDGASLTSMPQKCLRLVATQEKYLSVRCTPRRDRSDRRAVEQLVIAVEMIDLHPFLIPHPESSVMPGSHDS